MIENDDQGVESQFIDPFATVSNEAYPFPIEDYIPPKQEPVAPNPDAVTVAPMTEEETPVINEQGQLEGGQSLEVNTDETIVVPASEFTDTPSDPLDKPEGEERRISFEEGESTEVDEDIDVLNEIVNIRNQLEEIGGVSKQDVVAFEAYCPGAITSKRPLSQFSSLPTPIGLSLSLESVTEHILTAIRKVVDWIIRLVKRIMGWVQSLLEHADTTNLYEVTKKWKNTIAMAKRIDSTGSRYAFQKRYKKAPYTAKAATTAHFIELHANHLMQTTLSNFNVGMLRVQKGTMYTEARALMSRMARCNLHAIGAMTSFKAGTPVRPLASDIVGNAGDIMAHEEHVAKLKADMAELASPVIKEYKNAIAVRDVRTLLASELKIVHDNMYKLQREALVVDEQALRKGNYDVNGLRTVKDSVRVLVSLSTELDAHLMFFTRYCNSMMIVANACERAVTVLRFG